MPLFIGTYDFPFMLVYVIHLCPWPNPDWTLDWYIGLHTYGHLFGIGIIVPPRKVNLQSSHDLVPWLISEGPETCNTHLKSKILK